MIRKGLPSYAHDNETPQSTDMQFAQALPEKVVLVHLQQCLMISSLLNQEKGLSSSVSLPRPSMYPSMPYYMVQYLLWERVM